MFPGIEVDLEKKSQIHNNAESTKTDSFFSKVSRDNNLFLSQHELVTVLKTPPGGSMSAQ